MIKKLYFLFAIVVFGLIACNNDKATEEALRQEVIDVHDEVMGKEEYLMRNKMQLDTILRPGAVNDKYTLEEKITLSAVRFKLMEADKAMSIWMERFDPELKGKSHGEKIKYYTAQKKAIMRIDSQMTAVIEASDKYLKEIKK